MDWLATHRPVGLQLLFIGANLIEFLREKHRSGLPVEYFLMQREVD